MDTEPDLPRDVVAAIEAGRKVEAIKRLREQHDLDLAEAKRLVDLYAAKHPRLHSGTELKDQGSGLKLLLAVAVVVGLYLAYRYFN